MYKYEDLHTSFRKGQRSGNWRKLSRLEKALYMASLWYSRVQGAIINEMLVRMLSVLVDKLRETKGARVFKRGYKKAIPLYTLNHKTYGYGIPLEGDIKL